MYPSLFRELSNKRNQFCPESFGDLLEYWDIERGLLPVQYFLIMGPPNILEFFSSLSVLSVLSSSTRPIFFQYTYGHWLWYDCKLDVYRIQKHFSKVNRLRSWPVLLSFSKDIKRETCAYWYYDTFLSTPTLILLLLSLLY